MSNPRESHKPCRGDDVEAWLVAEIADCTYEFERGTRNRLAAMLEDYRRHADTGTPLLEEVDRTGTIYTAAIGCTVIEPANPPWRCRCGADLPAGTSIEDHMDYCSYDGA